MVVLVGHAQPPKSPQNDAHQHNEERQSESSHRSSDSEVHVRTSSSAGHTEAAKSSSPCGSA